MSDFRYFPLPEGPLGWDIPDRLNMAAEVCDRWAEADPDREAIREVTPAGGLQLTSFGDLRAMADALAHRLAEMGIGRGDRVGVFRSQSPWTAAAHVAIWKLGAVSIPLFTLFGPEAMALRLADSGAAAVVNPQVALTYIPGDVPAPDA